MGMELVSAGTTKGRRQERDDISFVMVRLFFSMKIMRPRSEPDQMVGKIFEARGRNIDYP